MTPDELNPSMKESPGRYTNPFLSDEENDEINLWDNPQVAEKDFTINPEDEEFLKSLASCNVPSEFSHYTDKNVTECNLPELSTACYKDNGFHVVKDICVDDGLSHIQFLKLEQMKSSSGQDFFANDDSCFATKGEKDTDLATAEPGDDHMNADTEFSPVLDGQISPLLENSEEDARTKESGEKAKLASNSVVPIESNNISDNESDDDSSSDESIAEINGENCDSVKSTQMGDEKLDLGANLRDDASQEPAVSDTVLSLDENSPHESSNDGVTSADQQPYQSESPIEKMSKNPFTESKLETKEGSITLNFDPEKPLSSRKQHSVTLGTQLLHDEEGEEEEEEGGDQVSSVITYSGPIGFSGSISLRSDSSTTSVRSFAFPILQSDWNSSPVRMAKAERKQLQKNRGWRQAFLCCRF